MENRTDREFVANKSPLKEMSEYPNQPTIFDHLNGKTVNRRGCKRQVDLVVSSDEEPAGRKTQRRRISFSDEEEKELGNENYNYSNNSTSTKILIENNHTFTPLSLASSPSKCSSKSSATGSAIPDSGSAIPKRTFFVTFRNKTN